MLSLIEEKYLKEIEEDELSWLDISRNPLSEEFIEKYSEYLDWVCLSKYSRLSEEFINRHFYRLDISYVSGYQKLSERFIENNFSILDKDALAVSQVFSEEFIEKNLAYFDLGPIIKFQKLSEKFLYNLFKQNLAPYYLDMVIMYQSLSEQFIEKHFDILNKILIINYQYLSSEFREKHNLPLPFDSWMYWTREEKEKYIREYTKYEIKNEKVIAYKSCREDGYSTFSFHYHYEVGKEYESKADYNTYNDSSFGLSAWTKEKALEYCKEKLYLVEIDLDDLACVTRFNKIRCRKLKILEEILVE